MAAEFDNLSFDEALGEISRRAPVIGDDEVAARRMREAAADYMAECKRLFQWGLPAKDIERVITGQNLVLDTPPMQAARELASSRAGLVIWSGGLGCGKTVAAAWWLRKATPGHPPFVEAGVRRFVSAPWLARQSRYGQTPLDELEVAALLVLDDLGMEFSDRSGNFLADLDALMDARYRNMLGTVITTNLSAEQFRKRYGGAGVDRGRLLDRIRETGQFVNVDGPNLRRPCDSQDPGAAV